jgi:hypothetical protein
MAGINESELNIKDEIRENKDINIGQRIANSLKHVLESSTAHGFPNIVRNESKLLKIMWIVFLLASMGSCIYFVILSLKNYFQYEVVTKTRVINDVPSPFPTVTVCNINPIFTEYAYKFADKLLVDNNVTLETATDKYEDLRYFISSSMNNPSISTEEKMKFGLPFNETIIDCSFNREECNETDFEPYFDSYYGMI